MKISVIGFGNMGSAIVRSWIEKEIFKPSDISLFDADKNKLDDFIAATSKTDNSIKTIDISQNKKKITDSNFVLLAVKPQDLSAIRSQYSVPDSATVISILAGMSIEKLGKQLGRTTKLVRTMPNLAAIVRRSMTAFVASPDLTAENINSVEQLISAFGTSHKLESEELMDAWCALAGSGPGLVFYLMDKFSSAAKELGFSAELSEHLVSQVFLGSAMLAEKQIVINPMEVYAKLVNSVCSKGGTTESAISVLEQNKLEELIKKSITAACNRSKQLNLL